MYSLQSAHAVCEQYYGTLPDAMDTLSDGIEDALQFFHFDALPHGRTSSTNHLERLNREIRRRSNVVGIFPSTDSFLRLIGSYLLEYQSDWMVGKAYINPNRLIAFHSVLSEKEGCLISNFDGQITLFSGRDPIN